MCWVIRSTCMHTNTLYMYFEVLDPTECRVWSDYPGLPARLLLPLLLLSDIRGSYHQEGKHLLRLLKARVGLFHSKNFRTTMNIEEQRECWVNPLRDKHQGMHRPGEGGVGNGLSCPEGPRDEPRHTRDNQRRTHEKDCWGTWLQHCCINRWVYW